MGVPTGVATFNKGRGHVYVCVLGVLGVLVSTALGAVDDVAVWTRIVSSRHSAPTTSSFKAYTDAQTMLL